MRSSIIIIALAFHSVTWSQPVVYPLQVGTRWHFSNTRPLEQFSPSAPMEVIKDTTMSNGKTYAAVMLDQSAQTNYQRTANDTVFDYNIFTQRETPHFRFNGAEKETVITTIAGTDTTDVILADTTILKFFGRSLRVFTFLIDHRRVVDDEQTIRIADSIGIIEITVSGGAYQTRLDGAVVGGVKYGTIQAFSQRYYPLTVGNQWFYDSSAHPKTVKVVGDSLFPNNLRYSVLNTRDFAGGTYVRADSHFVYYYDEHNSKDVPFFKLDGKQGDIMSFTPSCNGTSRTTILSIDTVTFFGQKTRVIRYQLDELTKREISLSDKFGLVRAALFADPPPPWPDIVYDAAGCIVDGWKYGLTTSVKEGTTLPDDFILSQNYPNPFNPTTTIAYTVPSRSHVVIRIFNAIGQHVATIVDEMKAAGRHTAVWNADRMASGVYFYQMRAGAFVQTHRMAVIK